MIRVSVNRGEAAEVHEFTGLPEAREFIESAAFWPNMISFTWEAVKPCQHEWGTVNRLGDDFVFICVHGCPDSRVVTQAQITEITEIGGKR